VWHPHWHSIVLEGGFDRHDRFFFIPPGATDTLSEIWRRSVVALFLQKDLLNPDFARKLLGALRVLHRERYSHLGPGIARGAVSTSCAATGCIRLWVAELGRTGLPPVRQQDGCARRHRRSGSDPQDHRLHGASRSRTASAELIGQPDRVPMWRRGILVRRRRSGVRWWRFGSWCVSRIANKLDGVSSRDGIGVGSTRGWG